ncbi:hypothetical protein [Nonomuraea rhizosphaerae]|uniref:hypothetical protein n=1 Tax=Nonomuraea rhizosphaerae TaxID=2665663 RepID=UPI001C5D8418|nr:hypothetical protein [Nonomuraea rhizosphaerae]
MSGAIGHPAFRAVRAVVFAVACVHAGLGMHVLNGGAEPGLATVAAVTFLTGAGAYLLARRRRSLLTLLAACFAAQYGMHNVFGSGSPVMGHHDGRGLSAGIGMLLAHAVVALLSAWWLERGETALATYLFLLACSLCELWRGPVTVPAPPARRVVPVHGGTPAIRASQVLAWALCRRGPPR